MEPAIELYTRTKSEYAARKKPFAWAYVELLIFESGSGLP